MTETIPDETPSANPLWKDSTTQRWLATAGVVALGLVIGGYQLGNGLTRARQAERGDTCAACGARRDG
ncbi:MAG: hypothetical protein R3E03_05005 [Novosphingobium sp.]